MPTNYPTVVIEDFNIDMLTKTSQSTTLQNVIEQIQFETSIFQTHNH